MKGLLVIILMGCSSAIAQQDSCKMFQQLAALARTGEVASKQVNAATVTAYMAAIFPCVANDNNTWYYRLDTIDKNVLCQLYSSDSLYGSILPSGIAGELVFKMEKLNGPNPVTFQPAAWYNILQTPFPVRTQSVEKNNSAGINSAARQTATLNLKTDFFCKQIRQLVAEASINFNNISNASTHRGNSVANYTSSTTLQQNQLNNYIEADNVKRRLRYTEIIDDPGFSVALFDQCMANAADAGSWKKQKIAGGLKYRKQLVEVILLPASVAKKRGAVLVISKQFR